MADEEQFVDAINVIADKLGIAATEIFNIFVGAQVIIGTLIIAKCVAIILLCIMTYFIIMKMVSDYYTYGNAMRNLEDGDNEDARAIIFMVPILGTLISLFVWAIIIDVISIGLLRILCPEYSAISEIIGLVI